jgi:hypothetical protein
VQTADNAAVASQDLTDTSVQANVKTLAGQEDVALQLIEQSPGQIIDRVIMEDLLADYNRLVDRQVISGTGSNGQVLGILPAANWSALGVTWTTSTVLGHAFTHVLAAMASKVSYNRFNLQNFEYLLHGRRWFWYASALDASDGKSGRVIVNPSDTGFNVDAVSQGLAAEGLVGRAPFGPNVNISPNVPTTDNTDGGGATRDVAIAAKWDDLWLFEGVAAHAGAARGAERHPPGQVPGVQLRRVPRPLRPVDRRRHRHRVHPAGLRDRLVDHVLAHP